jgi:hypothetical protein
MAVEDSAHWPILGPSDPEKVYGPPEHSVPITGEWSVKMVIENMGRRGW